MKTDRSNVFIQILHNTFISGMNVNRIKEKAQGHTHKETVAGWLKEQIPAQTPIGSRMQYESIPSDALGTNSPICIVVNPQTCLTTSSGKTECK